MRLLYILQALGKGFSVYFFILLPIFYAEGLIKASDIGYIGTLFIVFLILGALLVAKKLHNIETKSLMQFAGLLALIASTLLYVAIKVNSLHIVLVAYCLMGTATGTAMSGLNTLAANATLKGNRYKELARLGILSDIVRIVFPLFVALAIKLGDSSLAILLIIMLGVVFLILTTLIPKSKPIHAENLAKTINLWKNRNFLKIVIVEFLDSLSSSQLFVFLPLLFLAKNITLQNSLFLQSFIFLGYISGRWFVGVLAKKYSGYKAVGYAEIGMVITITLLLLNNNLWILYLLSYSLGVFARGTSPAIKAMAFDSLTPAQTKKGSAIHVIAGDSGGAVGQLLFGLLIGWFSVQMPFIVSGVVAVVVAFICFVSSVKIFRKGN